MKSDNESHGGFGEVVGEILGELIHIFPGTFALLLLSPLWLGIGYGGYKLYQSHVESTAPTHFAQYSYAHVMEVRATGGGNHEIDEAVREFGGIIVGRLVRFTAVVGSYKYDVQATVFRPVRPGYYQVEIGSNAIYGEFGLIVGADAQGHPNHRSWRHHGDAPGWMA
jgi:hypothetical protein